IGPLGGGTLLPEAAAGQKWRAPEEAAALENPFSHTRATIAAGKKIYKQNCIACHGSKGRGKGPAAIALEPKPPRFKDRNVASQADGAFFWKISTGRAPMPSWGKTLSQEEIWQVIHYLHTFTGKMRQAGM
ncbi:MAG: c-type cytochrome, partial [Candidatus Binatia bacterium]